MHGYESIYVTKLSFISRLYTKNIGGTYLLNFICKGDGGSKAGVTFTNSSRIKFVNETIIGMAGVAFVIPLIFKYLHTASLQKVDFITPLPSQS